MTSQEAFPGRTMLYPREVAEALKIPLEEVYELIRSGKLQAHTSPVTGYRIPVSSYDHYLSVNQL